MAVITTHEIYVCPVHGETRRVVHGTVPFCVDGDCARDVEVLKYVHPDAYAGAVEALQEIFDIEGDGGPGRIAGDALRALGIDPNAA